MATIEKSVQVNVPVRTAYNQWTQFEQFPRFMEGIEEVRQLDDKRLHWRANIAGNAQEWDAEITEQVPDRVIAWRSTSGAENGGRVSFSSTSDVKTRVALRIDYDPQGVVETAGDVMGVVSHRVEEDLERFKDYIENRGVETGAWRGEIHGSRVTEGSSANG